MYTSTVLGVTDAELIRLFMVNVTGLVTDTLVAPLAGLVETRLNEPPSPPVPVVNELLNGVTALPSVSLKPPTVTLYTVETESSALGTKVSVVPLAASVTVPATVVLPCFTVIELLVTDV